MDVFSAISSLHADLFAILFASLTLMRSSGQTWVRIPESGTTAEYTEAQLRQANFYSNILHRHMPIPFGLPGVDDLDWVQTQVTGRPTPYIKSVLQLTVTREHDLDLPNPRTTQQPLV